jgi:hypothetical protein
MQPILRTAAWVSSTVAYYELQTLGPVPLSISTSLDLQRGCANATLDPQLLPRLVHRARLSEYEGPA